MVNWRIDEIEIEEIRNLEQEFPKFIPADKSSGFYLPWGHIACDLFGH